MTLSLNLLKKMSLTLKCLGCLGAYSDTLSKQCRYSELHCKSNNTDQPACTKLRSLEIIATVYVMLLLWMGPTSKNFTVGVAYIMIYHSWRYTAHDS